MTANDLAEHIAMHRGRLVAAYRDDEAWPGVRATYDVADLGDRKAELEACLEALVGFGRTQAGAVGGEEAAELAAHLSDLVRETLDEVHPPKTGATAGLSAIFANATASVGWWKQRAGRGRKTYVATCRSCGAAQETALLFDCAYCGNFLYGDHRKQGEG